MSTVLGFDSQREELLAEVAILIYEQGLNQQEVAERIGVSRSTVSRLLDEARRRRIVEVYINTPFRRSLDLQAQLCERFGLKEARVIISESLGYAEMLQRLGMSGAYYLRALLKDDMVVGIAWGQALYHLLRAFRPLDRKTNVVVVGMIGSIATLDKDVSCVNMARDFAELFGGRYYNLLAPLLVETPQLRDALLQERDVAEVLAIARRADVALVGIGSVAKGYASTVRSGYLREEQLQQLREMNAIGDICARYFDTWGRVLPVDLNERVVGITLAELKQIPLVIGIAGGKEKAAAILGALRGGYVDVLITDSLAATELLALDERQGISAPPVRQKVSS